MERRDWQPRLGGTPGNADTTENYFKVGPASFPVGKLVDDKWTSGWNQIVQNVNEGFKEVEDIWPRPFDEYPYMVEPYDGDKTNVMGNQRDELRTILDTWWGIWKWTNDGQTLDAVDIEELRYRATCGQSWHLSSTGSNSEFLPVVGRYDVYNGLGDLLFTVPAANVSLAGILASFERLLELRPEEAGRFWLLYPIRLEDAGSGVTYFIPGWTPMWGRITLAGKCQNTNGYSDTIVPPKGELGNGPSDRDILYVADMMIVSQKSDPEEFEMPTIQMVYDANLELVTALGYGFPFKPTKYGLYNGGVVGTTLWGKIDSIGYNYWKAHSNSSGTFVLNMDTIKLTGAKPWRDYPE